MTTDDVVAKLLARPPPPLEPKTPWDSALKPQIAALREHRFVVAALHLANDDIYACHGIVQAAEGDPTADYMHAVLHRREGDGWNAKYWFARLGRHSLVPDNKEAKRFVDSCAAGEEGAVERQWEELRALVEWVRREYGEK